MRKIFCLTEWENTKQQSCEMFMTLEGISKWLTALKPIDNKMCVRDLDTAGNYDINAGNLKMLYDKSNANNMAVSFTISRDFIVQTIETMFTLSSINIHE